MPPRVAMYLRQSLDMDGGMAVERQRDGCLARIAAKGWTVDESLVYVDNSVSASSKKARPAYERMLTAIRTGRVDVVVAWNLDRLTRNPREMEDWFDLNRIHGVNLLTSEGEELVDLSGESGRMVLRMTAAVARMEIERKARRQRESNDQGRALGVPPGGRRAFGYTPRIRTAKGITATRIGADGRTWPDYGHEPVPEEAAIIRRGFELLLAGSTVYGIAQEWNRLGSLTTNGKPWGMFTTRAVLVSPRYAALVRPPRIEGAMRWDAAGYDLSQLTPGTWEPLVTLETWMAAQRIIRDPERRTSPGQQRKHLLSGLARCGVLVDGQPCGASMKSGKTRKELRAYRCSALAHLVRQAEPIDDLVTEVTLARLSRPDAARLLERRDAPDLGVLRSEYQAKRARREQLAELIADGTLTAAEVRATSKRLKAELLSLQERMSDAGKADVLGPLVAAEDVRKAWDGLTVEVRRNVIGTLMSVTLLSPGQGSKRPRDREQALRKTAESVRIEWRQD